MRTLLIFVALCSSAFAQGPSPKIVGPTTARVGDIIILDASASTADYYSWLVDSSGVRFPSSESGISAQTIEQLKKLGWKPPAQATGGRVDHMVLDGGKKLILASYPGTWKATLAVSNKDGVQQMRHTLVVSGGSPPPPPPPPPPNGGNGDNGNGLKTDFTAETKTWLATVPLASRTFKDKQGNSVQKNLRETLFEIGSGAKAAGSIAAMETLLGISIRAVFTPLGRKAVDWKKFAEGSNKALDSVRDNGGTVEQYGAALLSMAKGLE